jgi:hypothetical protein
VPSFADEINDSPMLFALLQMHKVQISQFAPPESTAKQDSENCGADRSTLGIGS